MVNLKVGGSANALTGGNNRYYEFRRKEDDKFFMVTQNGLDGVFPMTDPNGVEYSVIVFGGTNVAIYSTYSEVIAAL